ncbi:hypothetical protein HQ585_00810 [candidate division KSB1 bacterium]|nr:hypothetical protein [candidate division KSB1 bacterium]
MKVQSKSIESNQIIQTDDLALSAYFRLKGYALVKSEKVHLKRHFFFNISEEKAAKEKVTFIQSDLLRFYNEIRNLKKLM